MLPWQLGLGQFKNTSPWSHLALCCCISWVWNLLWAWSWLFSLICCSNSRFICSIYTQTHQESIIITNVNVSSVNEGSCSVWSAAPTLALFAPSTHKHINNQSYNFTKCKCNCNFKQSWIMNPNASLQLTVCVPIAWCSITPTFNPLERI